jgi:HEAT repeats
MKRRVTVALALGIATLLAILLALPVPRSILLGFVRGESFYKGRPTSHWRGVVKWWVEYEKEHRPSVFIGAIVVHATLPPPPPPSLFDRVKAVLPGFDSIDNFLPPGWDSDPAAIPVLSDLLLDPDADVREYAALTLSRQGPQAHIALPRLIELLEDDNAEVRRSAAIAVADIETRAEVRVPLLLRMLKDRDPIVRRRMANIFTERDGPPPEAIAALQEALTDDDDQVRVEAAATLKRIER